MSDRTTVYILCKKDGPIADEFSNYENDFIEDKNGLGWRRAYDVNNGGQDSLQDLAEQGCNFIGNHEAGCEYGPMLFYGLDGKYEEMNCDPDGNFLSIDFDLEKMEIDQGMLENANEFAIKYKKAKEKSGT